MKPNASAKRSSLIRDSIRDYLYRNCQFGEVYVAPRSTLYRVLRSHLAPSVMALSQDEFYHAMRELCAEIGFIEKKVLNMNCYLGFEVEGSSVSIDSLRSLTFEQRQTLKQLLSKKENYLSKVTVPPPLLL